MGRRMKVAAAGDAIIGTLVSQHDHPGDTRFSGLCELLRGADVASVNLETSIFDLGTFAGWPGAERGGSYLLGPPAVVDDLLRMGFNLFARANNHAGDWGIQGLIATSDHLAQRGAQYAGVGMNMAEASRPVYLDTTHGRVAMVSFTTTFPVSSKAGAQRSDIVGRPGCNGVRIQRRLEVPSGIHAEISQALEAHGDPNLFSKANLSLAESDTVRIEESLSAADVDRVLAEIEKAAAFSDLVLVNGHTHEPANPVVEPPDWLEKLARSCIDAGADAYIGHGPHQLRGAEIYEGRPILYSIGNFIFHREVQDPLPAEQYELFDLDPQTAAPHEYLAARDGSGHLLSMTGSVYYESLIPVMRFEDGRLADMELHPIELSVDAPVGSRGTPRLTTAEKGEEILARFQKLSERFGLQFATQAGIGHWHAND